MKRRFNVSNQFHSKTRLRTITPALNSDLWPREWKEIHYKNYIRLPKIILPDKYLSVDLPLGQILTSRSSDRDYIKGTEVSLNQLSTLLHYSVGTRKGIGATRPNNRFYPSAGARYPIETYIAFNNLKGCEPGLYHYNIQLHALEQLLEDKKIIEKIESYINQKWVLNSQLIILLTSVFDRTRVKYSDRGYRFVCMEVGHIGQNIYLVSKALQLKTCAIGGYLDDSVNELLDLDDEQEAALYLFSIGK